MGTILQKVLVALFCNVTCIRHIFKNYSEFYYIYISIIILLYSLRCQEGGAYPFPKFTFEAIYMLFPLQLEYTHVLPQADYVV